MPKHPLFDEDDGAETAAMPPRANSEVGAVLRVEAAAGPERRLSARGCRAGSAPDNDLVIPSRTVSRHHARFALTREGVSVEDLGSRNGTFYLGNRVGTIVLGLGARVQLGSVTVAIAPDTEALLDGLEYPGEDGYRGMLGASARIRKLFALLTRLEGSLVTVLIEGESGVGKEEVARVIHEGSPVADKAFVAINCGAISKDLVASELFGHRRGAFTGASAGRSGAFETANGGTLFLDEIAELPLEVQPALLRAIETGEVRPVGTDEVRRTRVRVLAATNRDLEAEVAAGRFREDLFYRLAVVRVNVPPLRGRPEDVAILAVHFARAAGLEGLPDPVIEELKSRPWPGNARELRNAVQAFTAIGQLPPAPRSGSSDNDLRLERPVDPTEPYAQQKERVLEQFTKMYLRALLQYTNGNQAAAARIGGLDRTYLGRLLSKYGMTLRRMP